MLTVLAENWKIIIELLVLLGVGKIFIDKRIKNAGIKKEEAIAEQELIKAKMGEIALTASIQNVYKTAVVDIEQRLTKQGQEILDLTQKYGEILLRNGLLEEMSETRERQYAILEKDHIKLKSDYKKLQEEHKEIRKELDKIKNL